jgi:4-carboxymuconolactone decarboxylase
MTLRFPPIPADQRNPDQVWFADDAQGQEGGPFHAYMRNPAMHRLLQPLRQHLRAQTAFDALMQEFAILIVAVHWNADYMFEAHAPMAAKAGLDEGTIAALQRNERPMGMNAQRAALYDFVAGMLGQGAVNDAVFADAVCAFGEAGVLDLIGLIGFYGVTGMVLNLDRVREPG